MQRKIRVYRDQGVGAFSYKALLRSLKMSQGTQDHLIESISAKELIEGDWKKECVLLIFPGGQDTPYHQALKGVGTDQIRSYVQNGGSYLGICAGAYFGCQDLEFEQGTPNEIIASRELCFFPGLAFGTLPHLRDYDYQGHLSASAELISNGEDQIYTYYNGGCTFVKPESYSQVKVLSWYLDGQTKFPALVDCQVGCGKAILSGVHLEVQAQMCVREELLYSKLNKTEEKRKHYFDELLMSLLTCSSFKE